MEVNKELIAKENQELSDKDLEAVSGGSGLVVNPGQSVKITGNDNAQLDNVQNSGFLQIGG